MSIRTDLDVSLHGVEISLHEWATSLKLTEAEYDEYDKISHLLKWHIDFLQHGDTEFSWQKVHDRGWFSLHSCKLFEKELKDAGVDITQGKYGVDIVDGKYVHRLKPTERLFQDQKRDLV